MKPFSKGQEPYRNGKLPCVASDGTIGTIQLVLLSEVQLHYLLLSCSMNVKVLAKIENLERTKHIISVLSSLYKT